jgi:hypothetical protein
LNKSQEYFFKLLGEDFTETLVKSELIKPETQTALSHEEIFHALKIVPKTVMNFLIINLKNGPTTGILDLPWTPNSRLEYNKFGPDIYSGSLIRDNKIVYPFKYRSLPGLGLIILSTFELYEIEDLTKPSSVMIEDTSKLEDLINEKLKLRDLISQVIDKKLSERSAIEELIAEKLRSSKKESPFKEFENTLSVEEPKKEASNKLKEFLNKKDSKINKKEYQVILQKGEHCKCPDCHQEIFNEAGYSGCLCLGEDRNNKVFLKKNENGVKISFSKSWDKDNINMLLKILQKRNQR